MYLNILAEMARMQLSQNELAHCMQIPPELLERKLERKKEFTVKDIFKIQEIFNKEYCTFEYLLRDCLKI